MIGRALVLSLSRLLLLHKMMMATGFRIHRSTSVGAAQSVNQNYFKNTINCAFVVPHASHQSRTSSKRPRTFQSCGVTDGASLPRNTAPSASSLTSSSVSMSSPFGEDHFLNQVERTVANVLTKYYGNSGTGVVTTDVVSDLPMGPEREAVGIARHLDGRLRALRRNGDCPRCWLQRRHCICPRCPPVGVLDPPLPPTMDGGAVAAGSAGVVAGGTTTNSSNRGSTARLRRIFVVMHHKEVGLKVDTAKLILSSFPAQCRLVVGGIGPEYQPSMGEMLEAVADARRTSLLLFPDETSRTLGEIVGTTPAQAATTDPPCDGEQQQPQRGGSPRGAREGEYDLIVLDGTWAQARKFHSRYFPAPDGIADDDADAAQLPLPPPPGSFHRVKLSEDSVRLLNDGTTESGHQLRRHSISWRQVGTFEATRLFLRDWWHVFGEAGEAAAESGGNTTSSRDACVWETIGSYQRIANEAALRELGPPRVSLKRSS